MNKKTLLTLLCMVCLTASAETFKTVRKFSASIYNASDSCFKDTTASAQIEIENGKLKALYLFPTGRDKSVSYKHAQLLRKNIETDYSTMMEDLRYIRSKYAEWSDVARKENVKKYTKSFDLPTPFPKFQGTFHFKSYEWLNDSFDFTPTFHVLNGIPYISMYVRTLPVYKPYDVKKHDMLTGLLYGMASNGIEKATMSTFYLHFTSLEQLDSFISAIDIEQCSKDMESGKESKKELDKLFK